MSDTLMTELIIVCLILLLITLIFFGLQNHNSSSNSQPPVSQNHSSTPQPQPPENDDVLLNEPWMKTEGKRIEGLLEYFGTHLPPEKVGKYQFLLMGAIGAGKSSSFNTILNALNDSVTEVAPVSASSQSVTKKFHVQQLDKTFINLCDAMGFDSNGMHKRDIEMILRGHVPNGYTFNPCSPISTITKEYNASPTPADQIHVAVLVLSAVKFDTMSNEDKSSLRNFREICQEENIPTCVLVTNLDRYSAIVQKNNEAVYRSKKVQKLFDRITEALGINQMWILPIVNYTKTRIKESCKDLLALEALYMMVQRADGYFKYKGWTPDVKEESNYTGLRNRHKKVEMD